jgi:hypothetical protein
VENVEADEDDKADEGYEVIEEPTDVENVEADEDDKANEGYEVIEEPTDVENVEADEDDKADEGYEVIEEPTDVENVEADEDDKADEGYEVIEEPTDIANLAAEALASWGNEESTDLASLKTGDEEVTDLANLAAEALASWGNEECSPAESGKSKDVNELKVSPLVLEPDEPVDSEKNPKRLTGKDIIAMEKKRNTAKSRKRKTNSTSVNTQAGIWGPPVPQSILEDEIDDESFFDTNTFLGLTLGLGTLFVIILFYW